MYASHNGKTSKFSDSFNQMMFQDCSLNKASLVIKKNLESTKNGTKSLSQKNAERMISKYELKQRKREIVKVFKNCFGVQIPF